MIVVMGALAAIIGPVLTSIGLMVMGLGGLATAFTSIGAAIAAAGGCLATLAGSFGAVSGAIEGMLAVAWAILSWPVVLGAAVGVLAVVIARHWDAIVATVDDIEAYRPFFDALGYVTFDYPAPEAAMGTFRVRGYQIPDLQQFAIAAVEKRPA